MLPRNGSTLPFPAGQGQDLQSPETILAVQGLAMQSPESVVIDLGPLTVGFFTICRDPDSNWGHRPFQGRALPTELSRLISAGTTGFEPAISGVTIQRHRPT